ncbi:MULTISPECIES: DUF697 domain-containing protein [unclassified Lactococcus]|uniref:DUF697 domain-containing protein n=1 Tax=unclassified Lactococcus TaxID=2643510 RepID=UPI0011CA4BB9|nr:MULTISPECIES: DUF697 domain-containing protein [unclassified Lactococcus]MQW23235.1 DUF697 domain-containing protein [Lactococcus sp. dk101]TXK38096.1 DUF697 domain-containing protein [Lactococcus sp. dk310]TXK49775.1 DUF697 domain-containing protein [Lactococcus sp. dk322]
MFKRKQKKEVLSPMTVDKADDFDQFFTEVTQKMPKKSASILKKSLASLKQEAEKNLTVVGSKLDHYFDPLLENVAPEVRKKAHQTIHSATLMAAIVTLSPIPLTDSAMLVPIQVVMMSRLHKIFGAKWSEGMAWSLAKETFLMTFVREIPGNLMKIIPFFGTAAGTVANLTVSVAITETLGWITVNMLNKGEDVLSNKKNVNQQVKKMLQLMQLSTHFKLK